MRFVSVIFIIVILIILILLLLLMIHMFRNSSVVPKSETENNNSSSSNNNTTPTPTPTPPPTPPPTPTPPPPPTPTPTPPPPPPPPTPTPTPPPPPPTPTPTPPTPPPPPPPPPPPDTDPGTKPIPFCNDARKFCGFLPEKANITVTLFSALKPLPGDTVDYSVNVLQKALTKYAQQDTSLGPIRMSLPSDIHITLIRLFSFRADQCELNKITKFIEVLTPITNDYFAKNGPIDMAAGVRQCKPVVSRTGYIVLEIGINNSLKDLVSQCVAGLVKNNIPPITNYVTGVSPFPHFSIAYFGEDQAKIDKWKQVLRTKPEFTTDLKLPCLKYTVNQVLILRRNTLFLEEKSEVEGEIKSPCEHTGRYFAIG